MESNFDQEQLEFIKETLDLHGEFLCELLHESIIKKKMVKSGELQDYFSSNEVYKVTNSGSPKLSLVFPSYGRLAEIGYFRSRNTNSLLSGKRNNSVWGLKESKKKKKKDTRFYSKNVYGSLNRLIGILMYEYDEHTMQRMKTYINNRQS